MKTFSRLAAIMGSALLTVALLACQPLTTGFIDRHYQNAQPITLEKTKTAEGTWKTFEVSIDYRYQVTDKLQISGSAALGQHYRDLYAKLKELDVYLFVLDKHDTVLDSIRLAQTFNTDTDAVVSFSETLPVVKGGERIAFGYEGRVLGSDPEPSGGGGDWFYKLPLR